jgi:Vta1 like
MERRLIPFLKRADELRDSNSLASFVFRIFLIEKLVQSQAPESLILEQLDQAEILKSEFEDMTGEERTAKFEELTLSVYQEAEEELSHPEGNSPDANAIAMKFYFASLFFEVLGHSKKLSDDLSGKQSRCKQIVVELRGGISSGNRPRSLILASLKYLDSGNKEKCIETLRNVIQVLSSQ